MNFPRSCLQMASNTLRVVTILRDPFVLKDDHSPCGYTGAIFEFLEVLSDKFHLNFTVNEPQDGLWGNTLKNGTVTGMIGMLKRGEVDMAAATLMVNEERNKWVYFLSSYHEEPSVIVLPNSAISDHKEFSLHKPFHYQVWLSLFVCSIFQLCTVWLILRIQHDQHKSESESFRCLSKASGLVLRPLLNTDCGQKVISGDSMRVALSLWWLIAFVLNQAYMSLMVAYLLEPTKMVSIKNINDLANQQSIRWLFQAGTAHETVFDPIEASGVYREIGLAALPPAANAKEGLRMVREQNVAFIKEKSWVDFQIKVHCLEQHEKLLVAEEPFGPVGFSIALRKDFPLKERFNTFMLKCSDVGLWEHWKDMYWAGYDQACGPIDEITKAENNRILVKLDDLEYIYYFYFCLVLVCCLAVAAEIVRFCFKVYQRKRSIRKKAHLLRVVRYPATTIRFKHQITMALKQ